MMTSQKVGISRSTRSRKKDKVKSNQIPVSSGRCGRKRSSSSSSSSTSSNDGNRAVNQDHRDSAKGHDDNSAVNQDNRDSTNGGQQAQLSLDELRTK